MNYKNTVFALSCVLTATITVLPEAPKRPWYDKTASFLRVVDKGLTPIKFWRNRPGMFIAGTVFGVILNNTIFSYRMPKDTKDFSGRIKNNWNNGYNNINALLKRFNKQR